MKKFLYIYFLLISQFLYSEIEITTNKYNPYVNEILEIIVKVPGEDTQIPVQLIVENVKYNIINRERVENFIYYEVLQKSETFLTYTYLLNILEEGKAKISCNVNNELTNVIEINVKPLDIEQKLPFLKTELSDTKIYVRENAFVKNSVFSLNYIRDIDYIRPNINMSTHMLDTPSISRIMLNKVQGQYKVVSAYSINSKIPGTYTIPESNIVLDGIEVKIPKYIIDVIELPSDVNENVIVGKSLKVEIGNLLNRYNNGEFINFNIELTGNANLLDLTTLKEYFKFPEYVEESIQARKEYCFDNEVLNYIRFNYKGVVNSIVGVTINEINIPLFNTSTKNIESIKTIRKHIRGNISKKILYVGILVIFTIVLGIILFTLKFLNNKPNIEGSIPVDNFNFSKREREIFIILVNGKSTKDIADELCISPETVKKHVQNILKKTNTNSRLELLAKVNSIK